MWPFNRPKPKQVDAPAGIEVLAQALTDQVCNYFDIPPQTAPKIVVFEAQDEFKAKFDIKTGVISIYGAENVKEGILAHEIAHAVISKHGGLTPRMHEILAGYAEYQITKVFK